jgi:hypothetical protein
MSDIHSCSYYCTRPACVLAQRDELRDKMTKQAERVDKWLTDDLPQVDKEQAKPVQAEPVVEPTFSVRTGCKLCGVGDGGKAMGYVCPRGDCPMKGESK